MNIIRYVQFFFLSLYVLWLLYFVYELLRLSSSCPGGDIGRRDFSICVDRWQLSLHGTKLGSFRVGFP